MEAAWTDAIGDALDQCWLMIFLVSTATINSAFCRQKELAYVVSRGIPVITVLLYPSTDWHVVKVRDPGSGAVLGKLGEFHSGGLPKECGNTKPVSAWKSEDAAWDDVCTRILAFMQGDGFKEPCDVPWAPVQAGRAATALVDQVQADERDITRNAQLLRRNPDP